MQTNKPTRFEAIRHAIGEIGNALIGRTETPAQEAVRKRKAAFFDMTSVRGNVFGITYDGQKNMGELGPAKEYLIDYDTMRARGYQAYLDSEIVQLIINRYSKWVIAMGLKPQAEPVKPVLQSENIELDLEEFNEQVEARFGLWAGSSVSDFTGMRSLNYLAKRAFINSRVGGDVLVVLHISPKNEVQVQLIDGAWVQSPAYGNDIWAQVLNNGNVIRNGVELDANGQHVAYHVRQRNATFKRIEARNSLGLKIAYLVYGFEYRINSTRGLPLVNAVLETAKKLERYKEATVGTAEEQAKVTFQIIHQQFSTGENPLAKGSAVARSAFDANANVADDIPRTEQGEVLASRVYATTNKQAFNMPIGSEIKSLQHSNGQLLFKDFIEANVDLVCATIEMPPNVAMSKYNDSFSASRAATKDWEHTLRVSRDDFREQFYQPIYDLKMTVDVLANKLKAPGYLQALYADNEMVLAAYRNCRFTGPMFPHIDPLKEVNAERAKLGPLFDNVPLTTLESATEALGGGSSDSNIEQGYEELEHARETGLDLTPVTGGAPVAAPAEDDEEGDRKTKKKKED